MNCPNCKSDNVRNFYIDDMNNELSEAQVNDLTTHEKELAAESECQECFYTDATEYFERTESNATFDLFEELSEILKPL
jgi:hypothetical protein